MKNQMMKIIFLDVDGVLNSEYWYKKNHRKHPEKCIPGMAINPRYVRNLMKIVKRTGAKIVLSSTWRGAVRKNSNHYLHEIFKKYGLEIYDYTLRLGRERGYEIQDWLDKHKNVSNIVILDDDTDMIHLTKYLVQTYSFVDTSLFAWTKEGLSNKKTREAIRMLKKPYINIYSTKETFNRKEF